jgi:hypothetical protein
LARRGHHRVDRSMEEVHLHLPAEVAFFANCTIAYVPVGTDAQYHYGRYSAE